MSGDTFEFDDRNHAERFVGTLHDPAATPGDVLTVLAGGAIAAAPGGGGTGGVQVVTVPVSSAEILDLFNTPVVLVPGVPGNVTVVTSTVFAYIAGSTPYTDNGGSIVVGTPAVVVTWSQVQGAGFWDSAVDTATNPATANAGAVGNWAGTDVALFEDTANPTLGDGTLLVTLAYFLAPTV